MTIMGMYYGNKKLQARYVWKNALKLNSIEKKLKKSIEKKIVDGL